MKKFWLLAALTVISPSHSKAADPWVEMTTRDLKFIFQSISENHPGVIDKENPAFKSWLHSGFRGASERAKCGSTFGGYASTLRYYANGFKDAHLFLSFSLQQTEVRWPGFTLAYRGDDFIVYSKSQSSEFTKTPTTGAILLSCDGVEPKKLMTRDVFPYFGNEALRAHWIKHAPKLLVDYSNPSIKPPQSCIFSENGKTVDYLLRWERIPEAELDPMLSKAAFGKPPSPVLRRVGKGGFWISVPKFALSGELLEKTRSLIVEVNEKRDELQAAPWIVIDVRGNTGGNSAWGDRILRALWGGQYVTAHEPAESDVDWRISQGNFTYLESVFPSILEKFGPDSEVAKEFSTVATGVKTAWKSGSGYYREAATRRGATESAKDPVKGKVFFLTDGQCVSACLRFVDKALSMGGVIHVGEPTSADTMYMDLRPARLPSGNATLNFAMKVYRDRLRKSNQPYVPAFEWKKDIDDTESLEKWIGELASH